MLKNLKEKITVDKHFFFKKKNQIEFLEMKDIISKILKSLHGIIGTSGTSGKK